MKFKIHRGTKEIGGSCVEICTENTRILVDFGMPLIDKKGNDFDFNKYRLLQVSELVKEGILPDIDGLYGGNDHMIDAVIISHAHQDHYGFTHFIDKNVKLYLGEATHKIITLNTFFTPQEAISENVTYYEKNRSFQVGDITITPYWADHSAFDAYSFLLEADGKKIFYSGDFRNHGRKTNAFKWFTYNAPDDVDYLLLEGTTIGRDSKPFKTEPEIEEELTVLFQQSTKINLVYTSGQNIDRIVSVYEACLKSNKLLVVDVYVATILKELSPFDGIPYPSKDFRILKVMFPYYTSRRLTNEGNEKILYQFKAFKITKVEISQRSTEIVMIVRPSMQKDLEHIPGIDGGNIIYSLWEGYLKKPNTQKFIEYLTNRNFTLHKIHTSGHADTETLKQMVNALNPKNIVPIHTFNATEYCKIFSTPIVELNDGDVREC